MTDRSTARGCVVGAEEQARLTASRSAADEVRTVTGRIGTPRISEAVGTSSRILEITRVTGTRNHPGDRADRALAKPASLMQHDESRGGFRCTVQSRFRAWWVDCSWR